MSTNACLALSAFVVIVFRRSLNLKTLLAIYQCEKKESCRSFSMSSRTSPCTPATILSRSIMRNTTRRCVYSRSKKKRQKKRRKKMRELFFLSLSLTLFRRTLIVNVEDRRQSRNNDYEEEKQRRRRKRKCNRFSSSERTRKISLNTSNRMVVVMVSSIVCVGCFGDQLQHVYEMRSRLRERERTYGKERLLHSITAIVASLIIINSDLI